MSCVFSAIARKYLCLYEYEGLVLFKDYDASQRHHRADCKTCSKNQKRMTKHSSDTAYQVSEGVSLVESSPPDPRIRHAHMRTRRICVYEAGQVRSEGEFTLFDVSMCLSLG